MQQKTRELSVEGDFHNQLFILITTNKKLLQGMGITVQELRPLVLTHTH